MKIIFSIVICISFSIYSQQIPTALYEIYKDEVKFDFSGGSGKSNGVWQEKQSMPYPRYYGASVSYSGNGANWLYVFGGDTSSRDATTACLKYNAMEDIWEYIAPLPAPMRVNSAARLGNKLYTMGGFDGSSSDTAIKKFYEYDIITNNWTEMPDLPEGIFLHKAAGYQDSLIYIMGGVRSDSTIFLDKILLFNTNTRQFREATPLPEQRANFAVVITNDSIYITGGYYNADSLSNKTMIAAIDPIDHAQLIWRDSVINYPKQVHSHFGYQQNSGEINFFGGSISKGFSPVNDSYSFLISENIFDTVATIQDSLTAFHAGYSYSSISTGIDSIFNVIITGGVNPGPIITGRTWVYTDTLTATDLADIGNNTPSVFRLEQNYPNPFNPITKIEFSIPEQSFVNLEIFNSLGEKVSALVFEELSAGTYTFNWDASNYRGGLTSGIYFYRLSAGKFVQTKKLLLLK